MSEFEVRRARMEVERSTLAFEEALDDLVDQVQVSVEKLAEITERTKNITTKVRDLVDVNATKEKVGNAIGGAIGDAQEQVGSAIEDAQLKVGSAIDGVMQEAEGLVEEFVDTSLNLVKDSTDRLISDFRVTAEDQLRNLRQVAEEELQTFDAHPLMSWGAVLASGFALGYILARRTGDKFITTQPY